MSAPAQDPQDRVGLVGCVKQQAARRTAAQDLFVAPLFRGRRAYVERTCGSWYVLSALHGLVAPGEELAPYDLKLKSLSQAERRAWSARVLTHLEAELGALDGLTFEIHAGASYTNEGLVRGLRVRGAAVELPAAGLGEAQELAFYHEANKAAPGAAAAAGAAGEDMGDEAAEAARAALQAAEAAAVAAGAPPCTAADVDAALEAFATAAQAVPAGEWPPRLAGDGVFVLDAPGLHSWWVDKEGAAQLSRGLGLTLEPGRIYLGQAGATKWPLGKPVATTLAQQISGTHLSGRVRSSDLRFSLAAALLGELALQVQAPMLVTPASEAALGAWMKQHLAVAVHPVADPGILESLERRLLIRLDPPLALLHMPPSPVRARLTELRRVIRRD
ncbi:MAG: hypothetical protein IMZ74_11185 [Actinobacteria bacterium]|nr:hypothetical protein [Actinomycetota bacterium]